MQHTTTQRCSCTSEKHNNRSALHVRQSCSVTHTTRAAPAMVRITSLKQLCASRVTELLRHTHHKSYSCNVARRKSKTTTCNHDINDDSRNQCFAAAATQTCIPRCLSAQRTRVPHLFFTCDRVAPSHTPQELLLQWCKAQV